MPPVCHVVGARPNFMKAAPVVAALEAEGVEQLVVHTEQHYDPKLSEVFLADLGLGEPDLRLGVGSGSHATQTAALLTALEDALVRLAPALVVVYGDVNSTLAAALVAAKLGVPVAHVEAGLRSGDRSMPEEVNRVVVDRLADLLFATSADAVAHLAREGVAPEAVHLVGNTMIDTLAANLARLDPSAARAAAGLDAPYAVVTLHRPGNVDDPEQAGAMAVAVRGLAELVPVAFPVHPRSRPRLAAAGLAPGARLRLLDPLGYVDFLSLVRGAALVVTDSGGLQEETTALGVPCLTVRPNTERPVTVTHGTNRLVGADGLLDAARAVLAAPPAAPPEPPPLWDGRAGPRIARVIAAQLRATAA